MISLTLGMKKKMFCLCLHKPIRPTQTLSISKGNLFVFFLDCSDNRKRMVKDAAKKDYRDENTCRTNTVAVETMKHQVERVYNCSAFLHIKAGQMRSQLVASCNVANSAGILIIDNVCSCNAQSSTSSSMKTMFAVAK